METLAAGLLQVGVPGHCSGQAASAIVRERPVGALSLLAELARDRDDIAGAGVVGGDRAAALERAVRLDLHRVLELEAVLEQLYGADRKPEGDRQKARDLGVLEALAREVEV